VVVEVEGVTVTEECRPRELMLALGRAQSPRVRRLRAWDLVGSQEARIMGSRIWGGLNLW